MSFFLHQFRLVRAPTRWLAGADARCQQLATAAGSSADLARTQQRNGAVSPRSHRLGPVVREGGRIAQTLADSMATRSSRRAREPRQAEQPHREGQLVNGVGEAEPAHILTTHARRRAFTDLYGPHLHQLDECGMGMPSWAFGSQRRRQRRGTRHPEWLQPGEPGSTGGAGLFCFATNW